MVGNTAPLGGRQFGGADIEVAIHLQRIAVDDFAVELLGNHKCQIALSRAGRTGDCNQGPVGYVCLVWSRHGFLLSNPVIQ